MSAIGTALTIAGQDLAQDIFVDLDRVAINLWFAGGFLSCLFWVRYIFYSLVQSPSPQYTCTYISVHVLLFVCLYVCLSVCHSVWLSDIEDRGWTMLVARLLQKLQPMAFLRCTMLCTNVVRKVACRV